MASDFEKSFADLAYSFLQQSGLPLMPFLLGFEIAEQNDKGTQAVGFFAFKIEDKYYYVPVFFKNGELKPVTMIYDVAQDMMLPITNDWINHLTKVQSPKIGKGVKKMPAKYYPLDFNQFIYPPYFSKISSDRTHSQLVKFLSDSKPVVKIAFLKLLQTSQPLMKYVANSCGWERVKTACYIAPTAARTERPNIRLVDTLEKSASLTPRERMWFMKYGYAIEDKRATKDTAETYATTVNDSRGRTVEKYDQEYFSYFSSPQQTGIYNIMTSRGSKDCLILVNPTDLATGKGDRRSYVIDLDGGQYDICETHKLLCANERVAIEPLVTSGKIKLAETMQPNKLYTLYYQTLGENVMANPLTTQPIRVLSKVKDSDGGVYFVVTDPTGCGKRNIILKTGGTWRKIADDYYIPKSCLAIEVTTPDLSVLGKPDLDHYFLERFRLMKNTDQGLYLGNDLISKSASLKERTWTLVRDYRFTVDDAISCVHDRQPLFMKVADIYQPQPLMEPPGGYQIPSYQVQQRASNPYKTSPMSYSNAAEEIEDAMRLSNSGLSEVFDSAAIGTLAKITNSETEINTYFPSIMQCVDKLGRMLFLLWKNPEAFKDVFSINEYSQFEDALKSNFKSVGDLALTIKQKIVPITQGIANDK